MIRRGYTSLRRCLAFSFALISPQPDTFALEKSGFEVQSIQYAIYDSIQTEQQYWALLKAADELIFQREFATEFLLLLTEKEKTEFIRLPTLPARKAFIEQYWRAYNPNPLLPENDRLLVHLRRRTYAREHFAMKNPPYFDDRGKYFIKYGKPINRLHDLGGQKRLRESAVNVKLNSYTVQENESWSYINIAPNYVVHFAKAGDSFEEIRSLKELFMGSRRMGLLAWYMSDLLKGRFWMSPAINETVTQIQAIELNLRIRGGGRSARLRDSENTDFQIVRQIIEHVDKAEDETIRASLDVPPAMYEKINAVNKLDFAESVAQFRGPDGQTRIELTLWSPLKNYVSRLDSVGNETIEVEFACLLRNESFDSLASSRSQSQFPAKLAVLENLPNAVGQMSITTSPQPGELSLQVKNLSNGKLGFSQQDFNVHDFRGRGLMMSDIQFFAQVINARQKQVLPTIEQEGLTLAPYPYHEVRRSLPLFCYFEVYNLKSAGFGEECHLTYKVIRSRGQENIFQKLSGSPQEISISLTNTRAVTEEMSRELISLDLSKLENGEYRLEITVADAQKPIAVSAQREFKVLQ